MTLFRSVTAGLLGACVVLLTRLQPAAVHASSPRPVIATNAATIVDVSPQVTDVTSLVHLAPGEHVVAVGEQTVDSDLAAGAAIAASRQGSGRYLDLTIADAVASRRVLVLMH